MSNLSNSTVNYRLVGESDFPILTEMYTKLNEHFYRFGYRLPHPENVGQAWLDTIQRTLGRFCNAWVAEIDDRVVGFILCRVKRVPAYMGGVLVGELSDEWIELEARRRGIADHLCRIALDWLREQGVHSVEIQVLENNEVSWNMLSQMGFKLEFRVGRLIWDEYMTKPAKGNA